MSLTLENVNVPKNSTAAIYQRNSKLLRFFQTNTDVLRTTRATHQIRNVNKKFIKNTNNS